METLNLIQSRINSIASTRQITQSMRTVSTIKVQRAKDAMEANRPFLAEARRAVQLAGANLPYGRHALLTPREGGTTAIIAVGGDRGLCGGYNISVGKAVSAQVKAAKGQVRIITAGSKTADYCRPRYKEKLMHSVSGISEQPFYEDAQAIADLVLRWYKKGEVDRVILVHTKFHTMLSQEAVAEALLPVTLEDSKMKLRFEAGAPAQFGRAVQEYLAAAVYGAVLEASLCEQSARMTAMDAAVKNAGEMIDRLTLEYHQARQSEITQEMIEIISGADAIQG